MTNQEQTKRQIIALLDALPPEQLEEVADFVEFLRMKHTPRQKAYAPIKLGGLWADILISDQDIAEARTEMWHGFGERAQ
ncbi:MAG: DUF2281 domain-containing protein [Chloroflexales bacterium]|nr:DUF2281 domain-containing protein [Chloroflexales bacterium]